VLRRRPVGPSLLLNPTFFNHPRIREASIPAANGHFSARALARFYDTLAADALPTYPLRPNLLVEGWANGIVAAETSSRGSLAKNEAMLQGGAGSFSQGFTLFPSNEAGDTGASFGHAGLGGSVAMCRVEGAGKSRVALAITLNKLTLDGSAVTGRIVQTVFKKLNKPMPKQYAAKL
jgi:hypothetical protein